MNLKIADIAGRLTKHIYIVNWFEYFFVDFRGEAENRNRSIEDAEYSLQIRKNTVVMCWYVKSYNYPFAWLALGIIGPVKYVGFDAYYVKAFDVVLGSLDKMNRFRSQQYAELIEGMEMLEIHVDSITSDIIIEAVKQTVTFAVDGNWILVFI